MNPGKTIFILVLFVLLQTNCAVPVKRSSNPEATGNTNTSLNLISDIEPILPNGDVTAIIEIPTGTQEKWEVDKTTGKLYLQQHGGEDRIVAYLGYPGNYGMLPKTVLPKSKGGDGDPLDILVLGPPVSRGTRLPAKVIGVLFLEDGGEKDDKLIAVSSSSPLYVVDSIEELEQDFVGVTAIIQLWFTNYKGPGIMVSKGFGNRELALEILKSAILEYQENPKLH